MIKISGHHKLQKPKIMQLERNLNKQLIRIYSILNIILYQHLKTTKQHVLDLKIIIYVTPSALRVDCLQVSYKT